MKNDNNTAEIGFEEKIWAAADKLRGNMDASEYKHVILGLIFLKYISDRFDQRHKELVLEGEGFEEEKDEYTKLGIFWVPPDARWAGIAKAAHTPEIGMKIDAAMRSIEDCNKKLKGVLPKNFARPELDKTKLGGVVDLFTNVAMVDKANNRDLLGSVYQYCLRKFATNEGKNAGEFYTPSCIVRTIVEILKPYQGRVYDPCCGSGGMFVQSVEFVKSHAGGLRNISIFGQESNPTTRKMAIMNLAIRGIDADLGGRNADTFSSDLHKKLRADFILANPPFNQDDWGLDRLTDDPRWEHGLPPKNNANYAWLQHMIHHLSVKGRMGVVLANGALSSQSSGEGEIRKKIIEADLVEGIVALPSQLFYNTQIPASLWFINKSKPQPGKTLFIDARNLGTMVTRTLRELSDGDIQKLANTFSKFQGGALKNVEGFCTVASTEDIAKQDYLLTPGRYIGIEKQEDDGEPFEEKMTRLTSELSEMFAKSHELETEIREKLGAIGYEI